MTNPGGPRAVLSASARRLPAASRLDQIRAYGVVLDAGSNAEAQLHTAQVNVTLPKLAFERAQTLYGDERRISPAALQPTESGVSHRRGQCGRRAIPGADTGGHAPSGMGPVLGKPLVARSQTQVRLIERRLSTPDLASVRGPAPEICDLGRDRKLRRKIRQSACRDR
jgi:hypothetical protein